MKIKVILTLLTVTLLLLSACGTLTDAEKMAGYLADARDIATLGTQAALLENPEHRVPLTKARDALAVLEGLPAGRVTVDQLSAALAQLPLQQLKSEKGHIYVTSGRILLRRFISWSGSSSLDVGASGAVQQFAAALRQGMDDVLKPSGS
jgi:hypothetical protein